MILAMEEAAQPDPACLCGHAESRHEAGKCWALPADRCKCYWFEAAK